MLEEQTIKKITDDADVLSSFASFHPSNFKKLGDIVEPRREKVSPAKFADLPFIGMEHIEAHRNL